MDLVGDTLLIIMRTKSSENNVLSSSHFVKKIVYNPKKDIYGFKNGLNLVLN